MISKYNAYLNESKVSGKYGFFMFLDIIDRMNNSFIMEDYLNVSDFNIFFTTDKIKDKGKLTDILEFKKSLISAYNTLIHIRNLRLSFYFGVRYSMLEYGFHDDIKRVVYKIGEFKVNSSFLNRMSSYKCVSLIYDILKNVKLKDLVFLSNIKTEIRYLFDNKFDVRIDSGDRVIKTINNIELKNYYSGDDVRIYFDSWCYKFKWYYDVYNYVDVDDDNTYFIIKLKDVDENLKFLKKKYDIKSVEKLLREDKETSNPVVRDKMLTEPLNAPKLKIIKTTIKGKKTKPIDKKIEKQKELVKYYKDLKKTILWINKDTSKNKSYTSKHLYWLVGKWGKSFDDVKKDIQWIVYKLRDNPDFIESQEEEVRNMIEKSKKKK